MVAPLKPETGSFDIVETYHRLLREDPDITMPVAAIESLVELLASSPTTTVSETLDLLATSTGYLKSSVPNPISLSAGTDLFQRYLINALQKPLQFGNSSGGSTSGSISGGVAGGGGGGTGSGVADFKSIRQHLISNGRLFVTRAKESRNKIAAFGRHFVRDGNTVLTNGGSRVVGALLRHAADDSGGSVRFKVIYVLKGVEDSISVTSDASTTTGLDDETTNAGKDETRESKTNGEDEEKDETTHNGTRDPHQQTTKAEEHTQKRKRRRRKQESEGHAIVRSLRTKGVPVAVISEGAVAYAMGQVDMVIVGAEGVVENGGIISRLGTYQMGILAKAARKPFYVVAESHKFVRLYPLNQYDLGIEQKVVEFRSGFDDDDDDERREKEGEERGKGHDKGMEIDEGKGIGSGVNVAVDFTPPDLISALITESGVLTPSAVSEELIKIWF
ncbi:MAG: Late Golgi vesicles protein [Watsoniomyces obsoletus]|nr:MAG: Late Golgi vesicles protein [Watsoniomyces obsoletus]